MGISKRSGDVASGIGLALVGAVWFVVALSYEVGTPSQPGPGFFPIGLAFLLASAGVWIAASAAFLRARAATDADAATEGDRIEIGGWGFVATVASLIFVTAFLEQLGFLIVTGALLVLLFRQFGGYRWYYALAGGLTGSILIYYFFAKALGVRLPMFLG